MGSPQYDFLGFTLEKHSKARPTQKRESLGAELAWAKLTKMYLSTVYTDQLELLNAGLSKCSSTFVTKSWIKGERLSRELPN